MGWGALGESRIEIRLLMGLIVPSATTFCSLTQFGAFWAACEMEDRRNTSFPGPPQQTPNPHGYLLATSTHVQNLALLLGDQRPLGMKGLEETAPLIPVPSHTQKTNQETENPSPLGFLVWRPILRLLN